MSQISLKMCARRAVRVTSVFSSAAASLRVRTDRDVWRAENCVRNTSGSRTHTRNNKASEWDETTRHQNELKQQGIRIRFSIIKFFLKSRFPSPRAHLTWCCRRPGWLRPTGCTWTGCRCPSPSRPPSSAAPASPSSSPSSSEETRGASAQSSWWSKEKGAWWGEHGRRYLDKDRRGGSSFFNLAPAPFFAGAFNNYGAYERGSCCKMFREERI